MSQAKKTIVLNVEKREAVGKGPCRRMRSQGAIPAIIYGHGKQAVPLSVDAVEVTPVINHAGILELAMPGRKTNLLAVIKDFQSHVLTGHVQHVDFQEVKATEEITATIPIRPEGTPAGEQEGGLLDQILFELDVTCAANKLPEQVVVDVSGLHLDDIVQIQDLTLPEGVVAEADAEQTVFTVTLPTMEPVEEEEEEVEELEEGAEEPEVISKGKAEEEGEGTEEES